MQALKMLKMCISLIYTDLSKEFLFKKTFIFITQYNIHCWNFYNSLTYALYVSPFITLLIFSFFLSLKTCTNY